MSIQELDQTEEIYRTTLALAPPERDAYLTQACVSAEQRQVIETRLGATTRAWGRDEAVTQEQSRAPIGLQQPRGTVGEMIGPYRLERELGSGGMGDVWLAARADEAYQKRVAIKLVKRGMDTREILDRFRHERQILASLDHPNIARLLDGGTTPDGLPYFVMEHIEGQPIDEYCRSHKLTTGERLQLFRTVCAAVQYAHQNLVVHRDLKPSNILVTADGAPKLLDFGIAKILDPAMFPETVAPTRTWDRPMTPAYASPEQVRGEPITTASDVYSLGVVLYELLTGQRPYQFKSFGAHEIAKVVCETEPQRPSTAVIRDITQDDAAPLANENEAEKLRRQLRGDLDNIVLMALRKEPERRYPSVRQFSEDIRRHLEGLPVIAREDTLGYRASKFIARHKVGVAAATVFAVLLIAFLATTLVQARRIARERDKSQQVAKFLVDLFKVNDPGESRGNAVTARELLESGATRIASDLKDQPETQATLLHAMGNAYQTLGLFDRALPLLEQALQQRRALHGEGHADTADVLHDLAELRNSRGEFAEAEPLFRQSLAVRQRLFGPEHETVAADLHGLGLIFFNKADYKAAEPLFRQAVEMQRRLRGDENTDTARYKSSLSVALRGLGQRDAAEALAREALATQRKLLGEVHPETVSILNNLAVLLLDKRDLAAAEQTMRELLASGIKLYGEENDHVGLYMANLGYVLAEQGKPDEAETLLRRALAIRRKVLPATSPQIGHSSLLLGRLLVTKGAAKEAEPLLRDAVALFRQNFPPTSTLTADAESVLGACLTEQRRFHEAEPLLTNSYQTIFKAKGNQSKLAKQALERLVRLYEAWGKSAQAAPYRQALAEAAKS